MKKFFLVTLLAVFVLAPTFAALYAETISWTPSPTWGNGVPVAAADAAKFTFYLRIWRGTNPAAAPSQAFYFGETRNGGTSWTDNILVRANAYVTPPLVPGDNVIVSVSAAFKNDNNVELDSWNTTKPGAAIAYRIPIPPPPPPPPHPSSSGCNIPSGLSITQ